MVGRVARIRQTRNTTELKSRTKGWGHFFSSKDEIV